MEKIMNELYYMIDEWAGQHNENEEETKAFEGQKLALEEEIARRIGEGGQEMVEALSRLSLKLSGIHDQALFRIVPCFGAEMRGTAVS